MLLKGLRHTKDGKPQGVCDLELTDAGLTVSSEDGTELTTVGPERYLDIGYPGFFAGRAYLELPLPKEQTLYVLLRRPELEQFREAVDQVIGRDHSDLLVPKLQSHRQIVMGGVGVFVAGLIVCLIGHLMAQGIGIGVIFYGLPIVGIAMVCNSLSHIRRIRRIMQQDAAPTTASLADPPPPTDEVHQAPAPLSVQPPDAVHLAVGRLSYPGTAPVWCGSSLSAQQRETGRDEIAAEPDLEAGRPIPLHRRA